MVRYFLVFLLAVSFSNASVYEKNCISCHAELPVSIDKFFFRYLLKYSSERDVKEKLKSYLKHPSKEETVMAEGFIERFGIKEPTKLNDKELEEAVNEYWERYKVLGKLK